MAMTLTPIDREALERAMELARREPGRREQLDSKLAGGEPWEDVAMFASGCLQGRTLQLKPWEILVCDIEEDDIPDLMHSRVPDMEGRRKAARLLRRLLQLGLSKYEPTPVEAIAAAEAAAAEKGGRDDGVPRQAPGLGQRELEIEGGLGKRGRPKKGEEKRVNNTLVRGSTNRAYIIARLDRDGLTDLAARVRRKEISAHAAAIAAGWRKAPEKSAPAFGDQSA
jgi:hypothetical protein